MKTCFLFGHREVNRNITQALEEAVERHIIDYGVTEFIVGRCGEFDGLAAAAVRAAKKNHPEITLTLLLPYHPAERPVDLPQGFDGSWYPSGMEKVPRRYAISRANRYAAEQADYLIAYAWHSASNARNLLETMEKKPGTKIENLG